MLRAVQLAFDEVPGVIETAVGYTGCKGNVKNPSYEFVCSDASGCAEAVQVIFDPEKMSYEELLQVF
jgi:peptide-methionine (S)-S-oxide reductase